RSCVHVGNMWRRPPSSDVAGIPTAVPPCCLGRAPPVSQMLDGLRISLRLGGGETPCRFLFLPASPSPKTTPRRACLTSTPDIHARHPRQTSTLDIHARHPR